MIKKTMMFHILLLLLSSCSFASEENIVIPNNIYEAVETLKRTLSDSDLEKIKEPPEDLLITYHMTLGARIRDEWKLWKNSILANWFVSHGVDHPDTMSTLIIVSLSRDLNGQEIDFDELLAWDEKRREELKQRIKRE